LGGRDRGCTRVPQGNREVTPRARTRSAARGARGGGAMTDLELQLRELGSFVELPPERELAPAVRARIGATRPSSRRRGLVLALALVLLGIAIAFAVPPARSTILRWLGIGNARIEFVDRLPDVHPRRHVDLGPTTTLDDARRRVSYHVLTSSLLGPPDEVHV